MEHLINDPKTTFGGKYWTFFHFTKVIFEHFTFFINRYNHSIINFGKINRLIKIYTLNIFLGFVFFCIFLKWSMGKQILLPFFIFLSPVLGYLLTRFLSFKINIIISIILLLNSFPYLLLNQTRPLLANIKTDQELKINFIPPPYLEKEREELYFTYKPSAYVNFKEITNNIQNKNVN